MRARIPQLHDICHNLLDLLLKYVLDLSAEHLVLSNDDLHKIFCLTEVFNLFIYYSDLSFDSFDLFLELSSFLCILETHVVGLFCLVFDLDCIDLLLIRILLKAKLIVEESSLCFTQSLILHDYIFSQFDSLLFLCNN